MDYSGETPALHEGVDRGPDKQGRPVEVARVWKRLSVTAFFFVQGLAFATWASRIPDIKQYLQVDEGIWGNVLFALPLGLMVSLPISGWLVTHYGSRKMVIVGAILYALTLVGIGFAPGMWYLVGALFLFGIWGNMVNIAVNTQAIGVEELYGQSIMASFHGAWSLAGFSGAAIASAMVLMGVSTGVHFLLVTCTALVLMVVFYKNLLASGARASTQPVFVKPDSKLLRLGVIGFFGMFSEGAMFDWSGLYFKDTVLASPNIVPLGYLSFMSTMTGGRFVGDYLANRLGRKTMLQLSGVCICAGLAVSVAFPMVATAIAGFLLVGFGVSSVVPLVYGAAGKSGSMSAGMALAAVSSISFFGFLLGPPLIGRIAALSSLRFSFALVAVMGLCVALLASRSKLLQEQ